MEENKNCCEAKEECCKGKCCCSMRAYCFIKKHKCLRILIIIVALLIAFCLGAQYGKAKSFFKIHNCNYHKNYMMMDNNFKDNDYMMMKYKENNIPPKMELEVKEVENKVE